MAAPPSPATVSVGQKISAALWNAQVRDILNFLLSPSRCHVYQTVTTTLTTGVWAVLPFDTEQYDTDNMHSTVSNTSRIVATTSGLYRVNAVVGYASNATGIRIIELRKNAAGSQAGGTACGEGRHLVTGGAGTDYVELSADVQMSAGDYVELFAQQTSGGNLATQAGAFQTFVQAELTANS